MKITYQIFGTVAACVGLFFLASASQANAVKGGERLTQLNGSAVVATPGTSVPRVMSCGDCKDTAVTTSDTTARGAAVLLAHGTPTKTVAAHGCATCETKVRAIQAGKHSPAEVVTHRCAGCGAASTKCEIAAVTR